MTNQTNTITIEYPKNALTGKEYTGGNIDRLLETEMEVQTWATFKQWKSLGMKIIKGSKGTEIYKVVTVKDKNDPEKTKRVPKRFYVFNISQVQEK